MRIASYIIGVLMLVACSAGDTSEEHYRRGRMLAGQNRSAEAMREYLLAVDVADDTQAVMKAVSELGHLSLNQKMFEKDGTADELNQFLRLFPQEKGL